jgi:hypothetical protein
MAMGGNSGYLVNPTQDYMGQAARGVDGIAQVRAENTKRRSTI